MLGSLDDADDALQEAWLRLSRRENDGIENAGGWLTTVVARICVDMLRARRSKREESLELRIPDFIVSREENPEDEVLTADSVGLALLVVLDSLTPSERLAFVLHDMFAMPFEEIAPIVAKTPAAARQLASRARRRVQGATPPKAGFAQRRAVVDAFLAAAREGDFEALVAVLDPDVLLLGRSRTGGKGHSWRPRRRFTGGHVLHQGRCAAGAGARQRIPGSPVVACQRRALIDRGIRRQRQSDSRDVRCLATRARSPASGAVSAAPVA